MKIKRYSQTLRTEGAVIELAFDGSDEVGQSNPKDTNVVLRCQITGDGGQWSTSWERQYGNPTMPSGPWHAPQLLAYAAGKFFLALSSCLAEVDLVAGEPVWEIETGNTPIRTIIVLPSGAIVVLNDYHDFKRDDGFANIAAYSPTGRAVWRCWLDQDTFVSLNFTDDNLQANTWNCYHHLIDQRTGRTISKNFTK